MGHPWKSMAQNGCFDGHPRWVAVQTAILCHTFPCIAQDTEACETRSSKLKTNLAEEKSRLSEVGFEPTPQK